ncbi:hypothetical protein [Foetidibacter luteolus]|uniref:hypothetical protein n=1 Tax=Foetidibacter luteolus TaxID=2608880 RepID=UPI00129B6369|nr:hypothetical protein [Foetidibacter luteolus]
MSIKNPFFCISLIVMLTYSCTNGNESCMENPGHGKLLVFIGQKISVTEQEAEENSLDAKFSAKYNILEKVCGDYRGDTIEFTVYDHRGRPAFEKHDAVMLYVCEHEGKYYHQKYQYDVLYKTKQGKWAGPYEGQGDDTTIKPVPVEFAKELSYPIAGLKEQAIKGNFPEPYYKIENGKAIAVYGFYAQDLFDIKKKGVLKARGLFGTGEPFEVQDVELANIEQIKPSKKEKSQLIKTWNKLLHSIETRDSVTIKSMSLDSITCSVCEGFSSPHYYNDIEPVDSFIIASFTYFPSSEVWKKMKRGQYKIYAIRYPDEQPDFLKNSKDKSLTIYEIIFDQLYEQHGYKSLVSHRFNFVKIEGQFRFYGMESN